MQCLCIGVFIFLSSALVSSLCIATGHRCILRLCTCTQPHLSCHREYILNLWHTEGHICIETTDDFFVYVPITAISAIILITTALHIVCLFSVRKNCVILLCAFCLLLRIFFLVLFAVNRFLVLLVLLHIIVFSFMWTNIHIRTGFLSSNWPIVYRSNSSAVRTE